MSLLPIGHMSNYPEGCGSFSTLHKKSRWLFNKQPKHFPNACLSAAMVKMQIGLFGHGCGMLISYAHGYTIK
jgi:hypothetical protein